MPPAQGTKRKASSDANVESSQSPSQMYQRIKVEPSSPCHLDYRAGFMGDIRPELHEKPTRYGGSSSSDDTDDQRVGIHEGQGTAATGPFRISPAAEVRHNPSSRDMSIPVEQESDIRTARIASQNICGETNGLLRSLPMLDNPRPPSRQKASGKKENARLLAGSRVNDVDYNSIPDHSPPVSTLPWGNPHILQVDWRGKPSLDVFKDPDRHLLHQAELELVKTLNMSCAKYLCTKRRIFQACLKTLQAGKEFRRRDAQKACRIDAHKTNKLCGAFEKVGWFDRKYFLGYIKDRNNPLSHEQKLSATSSSGLTKPNIWDVSESEFSFSSEGDEDSTDDDTADSSVSFDGRHDQTKKRTRLNSYQESLLWQQNRGLSLTEGNGSQRRGLNDGLGQAHDTGSSDEAVDEGPLIDDGRSRRGVNIAKTSAEAEAEMNKELANFTYVKPWTVDEVMRSFPFLTDRAAIEKALQDYKGNVDNVVSSLMPVSSQSSGGNSSIERDAESDEEMDQKPTKKQNRRPSRPQPLGLLRETLYPETSEGLPRDDTEEVPMLETRRMTQKIRLTLNNHPGDKSNKFSTTESKSSQQESSMNKPHRRVAVPHSLDEANAADTMLVKMKEKGRSWHEIEEAWEKKTGKTQNVDALAGRYSRITANLASTGLQPDKERNSDYSSIQQPRLQSDDDQRLLAAEAEIVEQFQSEKASLIAEMESNFQSEKWNLVAKAMSRSGLVHYSAEFIQAQYESLTKKSKRSDAKDEEIRDTLTVLPRRTTRIFKEKRVETSSPSRSGVGRLEEASKATNLPEPQRTRLFLYQKRPDSKSQAIKLTSGQKSSADGAKPGHQTIRKDKSQVDPEQSARARKAWAKRRALGTNGRRGGPPKAKKAKMAVPNAAPKAGIPLAPTVTYQSGHPPEFLRNQTAPRVVGQEVRRDANHHKQSLAQIIPAASQTGSGQERIKSSIKFRAMRYACKSCGMSYRHASEHYRVFPNIGSEHTRRLAANKAAAESHSGPGVTNVGVENTNVSTGQMVFEISSK